MYGIQTVVSHSLRDVSPNLQNRIAKQLRMPSINYLKRFVECDVSLLDYLELLQKLDLI